MGVHWDSRSVEFRLLFAKYNKTLNYTVTSGTIFNAFLATIASVSATAGIADKVIERINSLNNYQDKLLDILWYGYNKKAAEKVEQDRTAAKLAFLQAMSNADTVV